MEIKILLLGLLFTFVNIFPAHAGPAGGAEEAIMKQDAAENYQDEIQENKIEIAKAYVKAQSIKAKSLMATANSYEQVTKERNNYYLEYQKLAAEAKEKARVYEQKAVPETALLEGLEQKRKEWEVKSREAGTEAKNVQLIAQRYCATSQEWNRKLDDAVTIAAVEEAQASGYETISNEEKHFSFGIKSKAEELLNEASRNHYAKAKEAEKKATTDKAKAGQKAEEAEKHHQAAKVLEGQILKLQMASLDNLSKYIALQIQAQEALDQSKEDELAAELEDLFAGELIKRAETGEAILKIINKEIAFYQSRVKKTEGEANMLTKSASEANSALASHSASMLKLAAVKDDSEIEAPDADPFADQQLKNMPYVAQKVAE